MPANDIKCSPSPSPSPGACESDSISVAEQAKRLICELILKGKDPTRPWSYEAMEALSRQLPIPMSEIRELAWFHSQLDDEKTHELKVRRKSESSLLSHWSDEVTRSVAYRKKIGVRLDNDPPALLKKDPAFWREFFLDKYGCEGPVYLPGSFWDLPLDQRMEWEKEHAEWEREHPMPDWRDAYRALWGEREDEPREFCHMTWTQQDSVRRQMLAMSNSNMNAQTNAA